jgi:hypothetical protein
MLKSVYPPPSICLQQGRPVADGAQGSGTGDAAPDRGAIRN